LFLAELTNIIAGLGFNGLLEDGTEDWSIINNANILGVEVGEYVTLMIVLIVFSILKIYKHQIFMGC